MAAIENMSAMDVARACEVLTSVEAGQKGEAVATFKSSRKEMRKLILEYLVEMLYEPDGQAYSAAVVRDTLVLLSANLY